jgi:hypothetical protein
MLGYRPGLNFHVGTTKWLGSRARCKFQEIFFIFMEEYPVAEGQRNGVPFEGHFVLYASLGKL